MVSTDAGMQIDCSAAPERKAHLPIMARLEPTPNVTAESASQPSKQDSEMVCTDEEMQID
jgi:hypothetical protein